MVSRKIAAAVVAMALGGWHVANVSAQQTVTLKFAMAVPPTHYTAVYGGKFFMERATKLSNGRIKFEWYPGQQLGKAKDLLSLVQAGVADMADIVPSYTPDKLPLVGVSELPGQMVNSCEGTKVYHEMTRPGHILATHDFDLQKVHVLMAAPLAPYKVLTAKRPVRTLDDLAGLKIRTSGGASDSTMNALGAVSVRMSGEEIHEALSRGTIDGAMYPFLSLKPFGLIGIIHYATLGVSLGTVSTTFLISQQRWEALPPDIRKALDQAGKEAGMNYCGYMDREENKQKEVLADSITSIQLSPSEIARWNVVLDGTKQAWAKRLDERGKPGSETLAVWAKELKKVRAAGGS